ncbi:MAG TPA: response regulator transcription factor [Candidatus Acidoferrales bacterium]|nr:response regulator transcription factor [Candidatus Acidoferrales bacterium]
MTEKTTVYILAANRLLREALSHTFKNRADIELVGASEQSPLEIEPIVTLRPDVLLVNGAMQGFDWAGFIPEVRRAVPGMRVVIFGMQEDPETFLRSVRAGVVGYLLSEASASDLVRTVRAAARDEAVCPPRLCLALFRFTARQASMPSPQLRAKHGLTRREQQLVPLIARGLTNKEIAAHLSLSEQTVKNHVHRILRKVGSEDRLTAVQKLEMAAWQA